MAMNSLKRSSDPSQSTKISLLYLYTIFGWLFASNILELPDSVKITEKKNSKRRPTQLHPRRREAKAGHQTMAEDFKWDTNPDELNKEKIHKNILFIEKRYYIKAIKKWGSRQICRMNISKQS